MPSLFFGRFHEVLLDVLESNVIAVEVQRLQIKIQNLVSKSLKFQTDLDWSEVCFEDPSQGIRLELRAVPGFDRDEFERNSENICVRMCY